MSNITSTITTLSDSIIHWLTPLHQPQFKRINFLKLEAYWKIGELISQQPSKEINASFLKELANEITTSLNSNYSKTAFKEMLQFYNAFPKYEKIHPELSWTHYKILMRLKNPAARQYYSKEAGLHHWNLDSLKRHIKSLHFERLVEKSADQTTNFIPQLILKDLYILEFLSLADQNKFLEKELEDTLLEKLQFFLMELGEGFAFVARQKRIVTITGKQFFIDLVFYHFKLKRFILIELKVGELSHRDIGQLDMYVRLFDEKWKSEQDQPTIGIVLCRDTDPTIIRYSVLQESHQLFAAKYRLNLPTDGLDNRVRQALRRVKW